MNSVLRLLLLTFCVSLWGFTPQNELADDLLKQSYKYLQNLEDLSAEFHYVIESPRRGKISQNGLLMFKQGMYTLKLQDHDIYFDGYSHTIYLKGSNQYRQMEHSPAESIGLVQFMYGIYQSDSDKEYIAKVEIDGQSFHKIRLKMTSNDVPYKEAILWMNPDNKLIEKISFIDLKKTITTYNFGRISVNPGFTRDEFIFDRNQYPGATEID